MNWNTIEYAAFSHPKSAPKMTSSAQLLAKMKPQMVLPVRLATSSEMKSVPPVEAPALSAMAIERPEMNPPKTTSMIWSSRMAGTRGT